MKACNEVRKKLVEVAEPPRPELAEHLAGCVTCAWFAARLAHARRALREHHAGVEPDAGFVARVVSRLGRPADLVGFAALRLLPAAIALALVLGVLVQMRPTVAEETTASVTEESAGDDLLVWLAELPGGETGAGTGAGTGDVR